MEQMKRYAKVSKAKAGEMGVDLTTHIPFPDGDYLLWRADFATDMQFMSFEEAVAKAGGIPMTSQEAAAEQRGETKTPLPSATPEDPESIVNEVEGNAEEAQSDNG